MIGGDRGGDVLQQHRLAGLRRRDDQAALTLADRRHQIDGAGGQILGRTVAALELQPLGRMQRRQILEQHLAARALRRIEIDLADLEQREIALAVLRRTDQAGDRIAGAQIEAANLARGDVDVVRTGEIARVGRAQEAEAVLQDLEHAVAVDVLALAGVRLEHAENDVLLARAAHVLEAHGLGQLDQIADRTLLELRQIHRAAAAREVRRRNDLQIIAALGQIAVILVRGPAAVGVAVAVVVALAIGAIRASAALPAAALLPALSALSAAGLIA